MLFHFRLRDLNQVTPWTRSDGQHELHWFALTDGWYWIQVGETELFRYNSTLVEKWTCEYSNEPWQEALPYVDYYVVRLWEDVLDLAAYALEPVPPRLARTITPGGTWSAWVRDAQTAVEEAPTERKAWLLLDDAIDWWGRRYLDTAYLLAGPDICFWSDGTSIHIQWDNRDRVLEGMPAWEAVLGEFMLPVQEFVDELRSFDARLLRRMRDRIALAQVELQQPDVLIDPGLGRDHQSRARYLSERFEAPVRYEPTDWKAVFRAIAEIEALPTFTSGRFPRVL